MRELTACSSKLDNTRTKGHALIADPISTLTSPWLPGQVEGQLTQLAEGLEALDQTAKKIQARLQASVQQQQKYRDALQQCHDWVLQAWKMVPMATQGSEVKARSLEAAEKQVEALKVTTDRWGYHMSIPYLFCFLFQCFKKFDFWSFLSSSKFF